MNITRSWSWDATGPVRDIRPLTSKLPGLREKGGFLRIQLRDLRVFKRSVELQQPMKAFVTLPQVPDAAPPCVVIHQTGSAYSRPRVVPSIVSPAMLTHAVRLQRMVAVCRVPTVVAYKSLLGVGHTPGGPPNTGENPPAPR